MQCTRGAAQQPMLHDLRGHRSATTMIVRRRTFLPLLLFFLWWFFHIGFDKRWRRRFQLFQLFDSQEGGTEQFLRLLEGFTQFLVFFLKVERFFFCHRHALSLPEWSSLNNYRITRAGSMLLLLLGHVAPSACF